MDTRLEIANLVTAIVLTRDEAGQISRCLDAIPANIPRVVVDSGSHDLTVELAKEAGATVIHNPWKGFADQRNFALRGWGLGTEWVLFIDADEQFQPEFFSWMQSTLIADVDLDAFEVPSTLFLDGRPLNHAPGYPILHPRLVRRSVVFMPNHNGHGETLEPCRKAVSPTGYKHYFQSGDLGPWLAKHVRLAGLQAAATAKPTTRRGRLSRFAPRGLTRAFARFFYHFIWCGGFRDGSSGYRYSLMYAWYEFTIFLIRESRRELA